MKIEILYSELYIYGEKESALFFADLMREKGHEVVMTSYHDVPTFSKEEVDCIYISVIAEKFIDRIIDKLLPYKDKLKEHIENEKYIIGFGSALDIFASELKISNSVFADEKDGIKDTLNLCDYKAHRNYRNRIANMSAFVMDKVEDVVLGSKISFSTYTYINQEKPLYTEIKKDEKSKFSGYRYKNVHLFEVVGCLFILNPNLLKYFLDEWQETFVFDKKNELVKAYLDKKSLWKKFNKI